METARWAGQGPRRMEGKLGGHKVGGDGAEVEQVTWDLEPYQGFQLKAQGPAEEVVTEMEVGWLQQWLRMPLPWRPGAKPRSKSLRLLRREILSTNEKLRYTEIKPCPMSQVSTRQSLA